MSFKEHNVTAYVLKTVAVIINTFDFMGSTYHVIKTDTAGKRELKVISPDELAAFEEEASSNG